MYDLLKITVSSVLMPLPFAILLIVFGFVLLKLQRHTFGFISTSIGGLCLILFSWAPFANFVLLPIERTYPTLMSLPSQQPTAIIVLGGGWFPGDEVSSTSKLSASSRARLIEGIRLWRQNPDNLLIVSGADRDPSIPAVAEGYKLAAIDLGVPAAKIIALDSPVDTGKEAKAVKAWQQSIASNYQLILVTSASHMPRAMLHFKSVGLTPIAAPTHYRVQPFVPSLRYWVPSGNNLLNTEIAWREWLATRAVQFEH